MNDGHCGVMTKMTACQQHQRHRGEEDDNDWFLRHIANRVVSPHHCWILVSVGVGGQCERESLCQRVGLSRCDRNDSLQFFLFDLLLSLY